MKRSLDPDVRLFGALADPTRLAIVRQLAGEGQVCACDFTACCDVSQPTVSHHLKVLREAGVVSAERHGTWIYYRLQPAMLERLSSFVKDLSTGPLPGDFVPVTAITRSRATGPVAAQPVD